MVVTSFVVVPIGLPILVMGFPHGDSGAELLHPTLAPPSPRSGPHSNDCPHFEEPIPEDDSGEEEHGAQAEPEVDKLADKANHMKIIK